MGNEAGKKKQINKNIIVLNNSKDDAIKFTKILEELRKNKNKIITVIEVCEKNKSNQ